MQLEPRVRVCPSALLACAPGPLAGPGQVASVSPASGGLSTDARPPACPHPRALEQGRPGDPVMPFPVFHANSAGRSSEGLPLVSLTGTWNRT